MKSLEICKSNLYKTKGLNNILLLDSPLGLDIIADSGLMNKSNVLCCGKLAISISLAYASGAKEFPLNKGFFH